MYAKTLYYAIHNTMIFSILILFMLFRKKPGGRKEAEKTNKFKNYD
jgi:hypothetical protein